MGTWSAWPLLLAKACGLLARHVLLKITCLWWCGVSSPSGEPLQEGQGPNVIIRW